ncbi:MAG: hypothetical protein KQJ78_08030 [Deltaproteobacteria bacterium]|nr:hypothetical protein [Deltaproteobacteria bacterium]MCB2186349.1 hypothetical protein [Deltaproteobacteria bacterium]
MKKIRGGAAWFLLLVLAWWAGGAVAQAAGLVAQGVAKYEEAEFAQAEDLLKQALDQPELAPAERAEAHAYLGLVYLAQGKEKSCKKEFSLAKGADATYVPDPRQFPPLALKFWARAKAVKEQAPAPVKAQAASSPPIYVVYVGQDGVVVDLGGKRGAKPGQRLEVVREQKLVHPVTKKELVKKDRVALLEITQVQPELSTTKVLERHGDLKPGEVATLLEKRAGAHPPAAAKAPAGAFRLGVFPPLAPNYFVPRSINAENLVASLKGAKLPGLYPKAISQEQVNRLESDEGFVLSKYLVAAGVNLRSITSLFTSKEGFRDMVDPELKAEEVKKLAEIMKKLGVDAVLLWSFEQGTMDRSILMKLNLDQIGESKPLSRAELNLDADRLTSEYPDAVLSVVREGLANRK